MTLPIREEIVSPLVKSEKRVKNQIWLVFETDAGESNSNSSVISPATDFEKKPINIPRFVAAEKRQRKSSMFEPS